MTFQFRVRYFRKQNNGMEVLTSSVIRAHNFEEACKKICAKFNITENDIYREEKKHA